MPAPREILNLVDQFASNVHVYKSSSYKEAHVRHDFIDKLFESLGWDVNNQHHLAPSSQEVIHEDTLRISGRAKAPDYGFRVVQQTGQVRKKFFVEAKAPSVNIETNPDSAYQLRRYGWSAKLPVSILTDFEELAVYDCRFRPAVDDKASTARLSFIRYTEYEVRWDEIESTFSRAAVTDGRFDAFAESTKAKRGTHEVDDAFLTEIEKWRERLAENIATKNNITTRNLNFAVQQIIDRIIFLRICEDRDIEEYGRLQDAVAGVGTYKRLQSLFVQADGRYNSGLFHFSPERDREESPDTITPTLNIDDKPLKDIVKCLYYPESPYEFSVFPADILGQVYERFLGKVIRLTDRHSAIVEERPEVKKAGGVYYTPTFVVDYIVQNTIGHVCNGKTPKQISNLRVIDPACGSGSFLIAAYQFLLDWHRDWYIANNPAKYREDMAKVGPNDWRLTTAARRRILLGNIYGVDIDPQAVEVTKLSLMLKVLEGESKESLKDQLRLFHERALPDLCKNIKCGNSLIESDYYDNQQLSILDDEERLIVNAFDWKQEFPVAFDREDGGFDIVIGNPPYGYMIPKLHASYYERRYAHQDYQKDLYLLFLERYSLVLRGKGALGVIVSNTWLQSVTLRKIRAHLSSNYHWRRVLLLPEKVFQAIVDTHVLVFDKAQADGPQVGTVAIDVRGDGIIRVSHELQLQGIPRNGDAINVAAGEAAQALYRKIRDGSRLLKDVCDVFNGIKPFEKGKGTPPQTARTLKDKPFVAEGAKPGKGWSPLLGGSLIRQYEVLWRNDYWIQYGPHLAAPRDPAIFEAENKIMVRQTGDSIIAALVGKGFIARNNIHILLLSDLSYDYRFVLGVLNSGLTNFFYSMMNPEKGEVFAEVKKFHVEQLPLPLADFSSGGMKAIHDRIATLAGEVLDLVRRRGAESNPQMKRMLEQQVVIARRQIDKMIYDLYDLSADEIAVVECPA